ncbi:hypothetical protein SAMN05443244_2778 [Terriglobus roseus]|uniref:Uncharacterized protein n=1 Tax=Terriglobus roseus TaxID=392734 RepID=A0A1H4Q675_9BACT|nr:hypothetical protein SAMN05443244_2778 [Terriglobus roseus]
MEDAAGEGRSVMLLKSTGNYAAKPPSMRMLAPVM